MGQLNECPSARKWQNAPAGGVLRCLALVQNNAGCAEEGRVSSPDHLGWAARTFGVQDAWQSTMEPLGWAPRCGLPRKEQQDVMGG